MTIKFVLTKFKVEKENNILNFEVEIQIPEIRKSVIVIYDSKQFTIKGIELKQNHELYKIISELEKLLESPLIKELAKHSRKKESRRAFTLTKIENYPEGILANLKYTFNDKYLEFGNVLIYPAYKDPNKLCRVDLEIETNTAANTKTLYDVLNTICMSSVRIFIDIERVNKILDMILQLLQTRTVTIS